MSSPNFISRQQKRNKTFDVLLPNEKMLLLEASHAKKYSNHRFFGICDMPDNFAAKTKLLNDKYLLFSTDRQAVGAMRGRYIKDGVRQDGKMITAGKTQQYIEFRYDGKTNALTTVRKDNVVVPFTLPNRIPKDEFFFRYITPTECERLQTLPDGYTKYVSDTQRYKILGNGFTVDVISHILKNIKQ